MFVYILTLFSYEWFKTGFLICHSFLDFLYIGFFRAIGEIDSPSADAKQYPLPDCLVTQCFFLAT